MTIESRATSILRDAESALMRLVAEGAAASDYEGIVTVTSWARVIRELATSQYSTGASKAAAKTLPRSVEAKSPKASARSPKAYPRFLRIGEQLVRLAWSKRERKEYSHKASRGAVDALMAAISDAGKDGRVFSTGEVLPIRIAGQSSEIPNYQAYVALAFLKYSGLIDQHGRQGYSILAEDLRGGIEQAWQALPRSTPNKSNS